MTRRAWTWFLGIAGAGLLLLIWPIQDRINVQNGTNALLGLPRQGSVVPWILGGVGAILLILALLLVLQGAPSGKPQSIQMGWHDDPDDPRRLRYHDGSEWTSKTADKAPVDKG